MLSCALAVQLAAQQRRPLFVRVVDGRGSAVADAEVVLGHTPLAGASATDLVRASTDARAGG
jgi:anion-transporting  ArsA/GET3 family ATPase